MLLKITFVITNIHKLRVITCTNLTHKEYTKTKRNEPQIYQFASVDWWAIHPGSSVCKLQCCFLSSNYQKMKVDGVGIKNTQNHIKKICFTPKYAFLIVLHRLATKTIFFSMFQVAPESPDDQKASSGDRWQKVEKQHWFSHKFWTVTLIRAWSEVLESLFNCISNNS